MRHPLGRRSGAPMPSDDQPDCPLSPRQQTRNVLLYASLWVLIYLASLVTYIGVIQANLLKPLDFDDKMANLPAGVYLWATPLAVLVVWYFPQVRLLRPLLIGSFLFTAGMSAVVTAAILARDATVVLS